MESRHELSHQFARKQKSFKKPIKKLTLVLNCFLLQLLRIRVSEERQFLSQQWHCSTIPTTIGGLIFLLWEGVNNCPKSPKSDGITIFGESIEPVCKIQLTLLYWLGWLEFYTQSWEIVYVNISLQFYAWKSYRVKRIHICFLVANIKSSEMHAKSVMTTIWHT